MGIYLNNVEPRPTNPPSAQDNTKEP